MKLLVFGMMRSGTTLLCDLLSVPGRSLVFNEPMMFDSWRDGRAQEVQAVAKAFGLSVPETLPRKRQFGTMANYFEKVLEPQLQSLEFWGFKEVFFHNWRHVLKRYQPEKLVLCVRDIRDITLSALDLIVNSGLAFTGQRRLRDEAWLVGRLCFDVHQILQLRSYHHFLVRYEDLVDRKESSAALAAYAGLPQLADHALNRSITTGGSRKREVTKHGQGISSRAVARFEQEAGVQARAIAEHVLRLLPAYSRAFGFDRPAETANPTVPPQLHGWSPTWRELDDPRSAGPTTFDPAFALRRARHTVAANIRPGAKVVELGGLLPALMYLLPEGCSYYWLKDSPDPSAFGAADPGSEAAARLAAGNLVVVIGGLEFAQDPKAFVQALKATDKDVLLTYHASEDTAELDRPSFGWRNNLKRKEVVSAFEDNGFQVSHLWAFDGYQSLFRLRR